MAERTPELPLLSLPSILDGDRPPDRPEPSILPLLPLPSPTSSPSPPAASLAYRACISAIFACFSSRPRLGSDMTALISFLFLSFRPDSAASRTRPHPPLLLADPSMPPPHPRLRAETSIPAFPVLRSLKSRPWPWPP